MKKEFVEVKREELFAKAAELHKKHARLVMIGGADNGDTVEALYFFDLKKHVTILRVVMKADDKSVPSISNMIPAANLYERELSEMFGIDVQGHPSPGKLFTSDDHTGDPPLLKKTPGGSYD